MQKAVHQHLVTRGSLSSVVKEIFQKLPCPAAVWSYRQTTGSLNSFAVDLLGLPSCDISRTTWISRIDRRDRERFSASWEQLTNQSNGVCTDYRFTRSDGKKIWLRDVSAIYNNDGGAREAVISTYTDVSDLKKRSSSHQPATWSPHRLERVISPVIHEIRNNLHAIRLEVDLLWMDVGTTVTSARLFESIDRINRCLHDLRDYLISPAPQISTANAGLILQEILPPMTKELEQHRISVKLNHSTALPLILVDAKQLRSALERVFDFCRVLLDGGGEVAIETDIRKLGATEYVHLRLNTTSVSACEIDEKTIFRPFFKVNNRQIGLGLVLARQILRRNHGNISFAKESPYRRRISILLKTCAQQAGGKHSR